MTGLAIPAMILALFMTALFVIAMRLDNNGVADVGYGMAFVAVIAAAAVQVAPLSNAAILMIALAATWGLRLSLRIARKNWSKPEDFRYAAWRASWGTSFVVRSFLQIYMLQGLIVFVIASPVLLTLVFPATGEIGPLTIAGTVLWLIGFACEAIADEQLDRFVANKANRGKIMMTGLWKYSRHPNYFGESLMWFGLALAAIPLTTMPLAGFISPILITFLLLKVSGVPLLEQRWQGKPEWEAYKRRTSMFVPLPPGTT